MNLAFWRIARSSIATIALLVTPATSLAAQGHARSFDIPAAQAEKALRLFSAQSGLQVVFPSELVKGVTTNAVRGDMVARAALDQLLAGTSLVAVQEKGGSFTVRREASIEAAEKNAGGRTSSNGPDAPAATRTAVAAPRAAAIAAAAPSPNDQVVSLSPFEVLADPGDSYQATNTNSLTGANLPLSQVPITADIYNRTVMDNLGVTDVTRMLIDVAGIGPSLSGGGPGASGYTDGELTSFFRMTMRGLTLGAPARDGLVRSNGSLLDSFSLERTEVIRGPQSLLYGTSVGGGIVNLTSKQAILGKTQGSVEMTLEEEHTWRVVSDLNIADRRLGVRVVGVREERRFWRDNIERDVKGAYIALTFRPVRSLTLRADYQRLDRVDVSARDLTYGVSSIATDPERANVPLSLLVATNRARDLMHGRLSFDNLSSFGGDWNAREHKSRYYSMTGEWILRKGWALQLRHASDDWPSPSGNYVFQNSFRSPSDPANPTGRWAVGARLGGQDFMTANDSWRALLTMDFTTWGVEHRLLLGADSGRSRMKFRSTQFYLVDAAGDFVVNRAQIAGDHAGRTLLPMQWFSVEDSFDGMAAFPQYELLLPDGRRYRLAPQSIDGAVASTPTNPLGLNGNPQAVTDNHTTTSAHYAALFSNWFSGRFNTLAGIRWDRFRQERRAIGRVQGPIADYSMNAGVVVPIRGGISGYYGFSSSFGVPVFLETTVFGGPIPESRANGHELGLKVDWKGGRVSGSIAYHRTDAEDESAALPGDLFNLVSPLGLNGRPGLSRYVFDLRAEGLEVSLTARPARDWNIRLSYSKADGKDARDVRLPIFYNDEFNTITVNGERVVAIDTGSGKQPLQVPAVRNDASAPLVPLTLAMLRDPNSAYFAQLNSLSGHIMNADDLMLTTPGVATGRPGLPIGAHQLGFVPPGGETVLIRSAGEKSTGYPASSVNIMTSYRVTQGRLKNLFAGASVSYQTNWRGYYYSDATGGGRRLFMFPDLVNTRLWLGYGRKIGPRMHWRSQLAVSNPFNDGDVIIQPNQATGRPNNARINSAPRLFSWTNSISF